MVLGRDPAIFFYRDNEGQFWKKQEIQAGRNETEKEDKISQFHKGHRSRSKHSVWPTPEDTPLFVVCNEMLKKPASSLANTTVCRRNSPAALRFRDMALKIYPVHNRRNFPNGRGSWVSRDRGSCQREKSQCTHSKQLWIDGAKDGPDDVKVKQSFLTLRDGNSPI